MVFHLYKLIGYSGRNIHKGALRPLSFTYKTRFFHWTLGGKSCALDRQVVVWAEPHAGGNFQASTGQRVGTFCVWESL